MTREHAKAMICRISRRARGGAVSDDHRNAWIETLANAEPAQVERIATRRAARRRARTKAIICRIIAALPCGCWPVASAIVRLIWPGMCDA